jgi:hypothetical protein
VKNVLIKPRLRARVQAVIFADECPVMQPARSIAFET